MADAVKVTMGPRGRNVLIQRVLVRPHKDGKSPLQERLNLMIHLKIWVLQLVKEVASNTADEAGDGTTTATVLAHSIFKEGLRNTQRCQPH
ncbi:MAG: hypothetical protein LGB01_01120 [Sulfurovum sp.]|nr:hypothetical protein [Sulfurovum sp.]